MNETLQSSGPLVSIVIPVYNVQRYIGMTIDSVLAQNYTNFELILVDDGSEDDSPAICDDYALQDSRIKVIHKKNEGVSIARNTGINAAQGTYLAFVDGDDELFPESLELLVERALTTGAEVVSGNVLRTKGTRSWQSWHQKRSHLEDRNNTSLAEVPELLYDTVVWNKLYLLDFWRKNHFEFPAGVIFEDMYLAYQAYDKANHIAIVAEPIYCWRVREEESSATQQLGNVKNVVDRELALSQLWSALQEKKNPELTEVFLRKLAEGDLWFNVAGISDQVPEFNQALCRLVRTFWKKVPASIRSEISVERRTVYNALARGKALAVPEIRSWFEKSKYELPIKSSGNSMRLSRWHGPKFLRTMSASDLLLNKETSLDCVVTDLSWPTDSQFKIQGWAYIRLVDVEGQEISVIASDGKHEVDCSVQSEPSPMAYSRGKNPHIPYDAVGFTATVDVAELLQRFRKSKRWTFTVRVRSGKLVRESTFNRVWRGGSAAVIPFKEITDDTRAVPVHGPGVPLRLDLRKPKNLVKSLTLDGRSLQAEVAVPNSAHIQKVMLVGPQGTEPVPAEVVSEGGSKILVSVEIPTSPERLHTGWRFKIITAGKSSELAWTSSVKLDQASADRGLQAAMTPRGWTVVNEWQNNAVVTRTRVDEELNLHLAGFWSGPSEQGYVAVQLPGAEPKTWVALNPDVSGEFNVTVPLTAENWYGEVRPFPSAQYNLVIAKDLSGTEESKGQLLIQDSQALELPLRYEYPAARVQLDRAKWGRMTVRLRPPVGDMEQGAYERAQREKRWAKPVRVEPENAVFFRTDMGGSAGDSALAIQQELQRRGADLKYYWAVKDNSVPVPPGGEAVIDGSEKWTEKIARSRFIVNNYGAIQGYLDHDHQVYIQTWHGTPLKIIGLSEWKHLNGSQEWLEQKREAAGYWDYLVTASPFTTKLFPTEFLFEGTTLELGMPRNDRLAVATSEDRSAILEKLGIDPQQKVLLYAPTYRDYLRNNWRAAAYDGLDLEQLSAKLGPEWTIITRGHSFNKRAGALMQGNERVVDATFHPDIADLYIASDACVTDYSSVMFDYSVTRKPLYFFVPDLEDYLSTRPMYMDLSEIAPSPLCRELEELSEEVLDMSNYSAKYGEAYEAFRQTFAPHDDGQSAQRVVDQIILPVLNEHGISFDS